MKEQIKQVQDYFKNKMLSNDFEITEIEEYRIELLIDHEYNFTIWIGNVNIPESRKLYKGKLSFMDIEMSDEDAIKMNDILLPAINKFRKEILLSEKMKEIGQLKNELNGKKI